MLSIAAVRVERATLLQIARRKHAEAAAIQADRDRLGRSYATPGSPDQVLALSDAVRRAHAAAHPHKTWPCEQCGDRTRLTDSACWNCATPRFPQVDTAAAEVTYPGGALTRGGEDPSLVSCEECGAGVGEACRTIRLVGP